MSLLDFFRTPDPSDTLAGLKPGRVLADGIVRVEEPLRSPVRGEGCVAFFYQAFLIIAGGRQPAIHKMKNHEGYGPFVLVLADGELPVEPAKPASFDQSAHRDLVTQYGAEYQATEEIVKAGARVRVEGKLREREGERLLVMKSLSVLEKQAVKSGVTADRKSRRKKKKARREKN